MSQGQACRSRLPHHARLLKHTELTVAMHNAEFKEDGVSGGHSCSSPERWKCAHFFDRSTRHYCRRIHRSDGASIRRVEPGIPDAINPASAHHVHIRRLSQEQKK